jgi:hypothetical protein
MLADSFDILYLNFSFAGEDIQTKRRYMVEVSFL